MTSGDNGRTSGDSPEMSQQPAVRRGVRRWWLIAGGVMAAIALGFFVALLSAAPAIAVIGVVAVAGLYAAMVVVALTVRAARARGVTLAALMIALGVAALGLLAAVAAQQSLSAG